MCPTPIPAGRHWDGSPHVTRRSRPLRVAGTSPSRLLRAGQSRCCRQCGNRIDLYQRTDQRPIALYPGELAAADVPESSRWHLSGGIAHPHGDGSDWCRIPHALLCPRRTLTCHTAPGLEAIRRQLAVRTRRMIDTGAFTPAPATSTQPATVTTDAGTGEPDRPVVQMLLCRYLAERPLNDLRCVAQTRHRHRCTHTIPAHASPAGTWRLLPATTQHGQLALPEGLMAVYDLGQLPYREQLRWRAQRCSAHAVSGAAELALAGWQPFDPLLHRAHIHTRLPHPTVRRRPRS
ncbi:DUF6083 domain-containing protein [Streptomyces sp. NBC_00696]|uniref:DUF6083 domain-containing protein n=1 Tax=Streptomyces sp. NBC_00696 TaxID=2903672 RepID=UPI002E37E31E|nr:DUF6083 domain-containing protein [Streptomyces sp. NBC_00696]